MKYSVKRHGRNFKISEHFTLGEVACKDGSDTVLVSPDLIAKLEAIRAYVGGSVIITSGYRTASYNKKIGGAASSQHTRGTAADIVVRKDGKVVPAKLICCLAQSLGFRGVGYISDTATHVDMRESGSYRGDERRGYSGNVGNDFYRYFGVTDAEVSALMVRPAPPSKPKPAEPEKEEDDEMIYKTIADVPSYYRDAVQLRINHGATDGKNIPETLARAWTVEDRMDPYIVAMDDVPSWAKKETQALIDAGFLKGTGVEPIGLRLSALRILIINRRLMGVKS